MMAPGRTLVVVLACVATLADPRHPRHPRLEEAYRANNVGVAHLEQFDYNAAVASFRRALAADPDLAIARVNLAIALYYAGDHEAARREAEPARRLQPPLPQVTYLVGLIARAANRTDEALAAFAEVRRADPEDIGVAINLGQLYLQERTYSEAIEAFRVAARAEPYNATAAYGLATALIRSGARDEGSAEMARFQRLKDTGYATTYSQNYLEQGRYAEAIASTGAEPELVDESVPDVTFADGTALLPPNARAAPAAQADPSGVALFDADDDGDLDLAAAGAAGIRLYRNEGGRFVDTTRRAGLEPRRGAEAPTGVVAGDYDNDGRADLVVLRAGGVTLYRQEGGRRFADVTERAGILPYPYPARAAAWLDADHDGDLDLFVAGASAPARLLRNNGNGFFTDITAGAALALTASVVAVVPTDFDNRRDLDLLVVASGRAPLLFRNLRDGTFRDVAAEIGLRTTAAAAVTAGDVNKDGFTDFFFGRAEGPGVLALSDGRGRFTTEAAPEAATGALAAQFVDYDNDGLLDLLTLASGGAHLLRNLGRRWMDVTARALPRDDGRERSAAQNEGAAASLAAGDLDGDGDTDLVIRRPLSGLTIWRNDGGSRNRSLRVRLKARVSNRSALGAKIEMRAGSLRQKLETIAATPPPAPADAIFGLGDRAGADVVRILWPAGILQAETPKPSDRALTVQELDRKPSSCPYLFTWNGERFEFITDFLGGGETGYWLAPGVRSVPDPDEYVRIDGAQLAARNGGFELRVTNELEEALFLDRVELVTIAHPAGVDVYPNEGLVPDPKPFTVYTTERARPPLAASDEHGHDVLDQVSRLDRRYMDDFRLERIRGYAAEHSLTITLPDSPSGRTLLLLTGWTDYAFSGDNVAAHQAGLRLAPPSLEVKDADGRWRTAIEDIGIPVGRPQTVAVDLTGRIPRGTRDIRITTTMRVYWDRVLIDTSGGRAPVALTRLEPIDASLTWRGFSRETTPDGREPFGYDYEIVSAVSPWKLMPGSYTREGDVRALLARTDDMFVVSRPGDAIALSFDAGALPALPAGWTRTFLLYANGYSKEMNLHSSSPDALAPLPFHGMTRYPYAPPEAYPSGEAHRAYVERYNTRIVKRAVPPIELSIGDSHLFLKSEKR
jgi:tetratricopeptide (TPR) repeat protein